MVCPYCNHDTQVTNSRHQKRSNSVWRRRHCTNCAAVFTTHEKPDLTTLTTIRKRTGTFEPLSRDRLFISIYESCRHRPNALNEATALCETILSNIIMLQKDGQIEASALEQVTGDILERFDAVAGTYYRAYFATKP